MAHTDRRFAWGKCPSTNCPRCGQGTRKRPLRRLKRRQGKIALRQGKEMA